VRSYLYCEDVAEAFEVVLQKGSVGHVYNIGENREGSVIMDGVKPPRNSPKGRDCFSKSLFFFVAISSSQLS
jgi:hypothetical protein